MFYRSGAKRLEIWERILASPANFAPIFHRTISNFWREQKNTYPKFWFFCFSYPLFAVTALLQTKVKQFFVSRFRRTTKVKRFVVPAFCRATKVKHFLVGHFVKISLSWPKTGPYCRDRSKPHVLLKWWYDIFPFIFYPIFA